MAPYGVRNDEDLSWLLDAAKQNGWGPEDLRVLESLERLESPVPGISDETYARLKVLDPRVDPEELAVLAQRVGDPDAGDLVRLSLATGKPPSALVADLGARAKTLGLRERPLYELARKLGIDLRRVMPHLVAVLPGNRPRDWTAEDLHAGLLNRPLIDRDLRAARDEAGSPLVGVSNAKYAKLTALGDEVHPAVVQHIATKLGDPDAVRLVDLSLLTGQSPLRLFQYASWLAYEAGLPDARAVYEMAQTLAENPRRLWVLAPHLTAVVAVAKDPGKLTGANLLTGLRAETRSFGVRTDNDLGWLAGTMNRLGWGVDDLPLIERITGKGAVAPELLHVLLHDLPGELIADRLHEFAFAQNLAGDRGALAAHLGMPAGVVPRLDAEGRNLDPDGMFHAGEVLDDVAARLNNKVLALSGFRVPDLWPDQPAPMTGIVARFRREDLVVLKDDVKLALEELARDKDVDLGRSVAWDAFQIVGEAGRALRSGGDRPRALHADEHAARFPGAGTGRRTGSPAHLRLLVANFLDDTPGFGSPTRPATS